MRKKLWYCKSRKKGGNPITEINLDTGEEKHVSSIRYTNVNIDMDFNNATGKAKGSGATTILNVDDEGIIPFDDDKSHDLQGRIDVLIDYLNEERVINRKFWNSLVKSLEGIRDDIPCTCDEVDPPPRRNRND